MAKIIFLKSGCSACGTGEISDDIVLTDLVQDYSSRHRRDGRLLANIKESRRLMQVRQRYIAERADIKITQSLMSIARRERDHQHRKNGRIAAVKKVIQHGFGNITKWDDMLPVLEDTVSKKSTDFDKKATKKTFETLEDNADLDRRASTRNHNKCSDMEKGHASVYKV